MRSLVLAASLMLASYTVHAVVLQVDGSGQLTGATGVDVNGTLYDVSFQDGTCVDLFSGCDEAGDFAFTTEADAVAAAQALLNQVFLDNVVVGLFDTDPELTYGCGSTGLCDALIPYELSAFDGVRFALAENVFDSVSHEDGVYTSQQSIGLLNTTGDRVSVWAVFTPSNNVPEPATLALMGLGLAGLGFGRRQRKQGTQGL